MMDPLQGALFGGEKQELLAGLLKIEDYGEFRGHLAASGCDRCSLAASRTTIVVDRGNPKSSLVLVGEGPGEQEDLSGQAFVGKSGQLLDKMMASIGLDTGTDLLIANIVKCRPPENRAPLAPEVAACLPYLRRQIELVAPRTVVLLGFPAVKAFFGRSAPEGIGEVVGTFSSLPEWPGIDLFVLYHPAYLLRDPRKKVDTWRHLQTLKAHLAKA